MPKKLIIEFSPKQTKKYLEATQQKTEAEVDEGCLPSGTTIYIEVAPPFGTIASVGNVDLGDVELKIVDV